MKAKLSQFILAGFIGLLLAIPVLSIGPVMATEASIDQAIENARTRADHEAIATYFDDQAKVYQDKVQQHVRMSASYRNMTPGKGGVAGFVSHCNKLMDSYKEAAKNNEELAKLHQQMAEQSAQ